MQSVPVIGSLILAGTGVACYRAAFGNAAYQHRLSTALACLALALLASQVFGGSDGVLPTIDRGIVRSLNGYAGLSVTADLFLTVIVQFASVKLLPIVTGLVWLWFRHDGRGRDRAAVAQALLGALAALIASRLIQNLSPHRPRPLHAEELGFVLPHGIPADILERWSSFPSDHAALACALVVGIWSASRPLAFACLSWSLLVIGLPRIYAGLHYPTDLVGGALVGAIAASACIPAVQQLRLRWGDFVRRAPGLFYSAAFVLLFQIATMFDDVRKSIRGLGYVLAFF
jgi:undecaprenyl-diphosphatase